MDLVLLGDRYAGLGSSSVKFFMTLLKCSLGVFIDMIGFLRTVEQHFNLCEIQKPYYLRT